MNRGFSLLEVLIVIMILVVGIATSFKMMGMVLFASTGTEYRMIALSLAQEKIEEIKNTASYDDIDDFASNRLSLDAPFGAFEREVTVEGDPKEISIKVYWDTKEEENVELVTLMSDY